MKRSVARTCTGLGASLGLALLLSGCMVASLIGALLPGGPGTIDLSGNYSATGLTTTLCDVDYGARAFLSIDRIEPYYEGDDATYRFAATFIIEAVDPSYDGLRDVTRSTYWSVAEIRGHEGSYGSPFDSYFGRVSLAVEVPEDGADATARPTLVGSAVLTSMRHECEGTTRTGTADVAFVLTKD